jgi:hypothetical protein
MLSFRKAFRGYLLMFLVLWVGAAIWTIRAWKPTPGFAVLIAVGELVAAVLLAAFATAKQVVELGSSLEANDKAAATTERHIREGKTADALVVDVVDIPAEQWREAHRQLLRRTRRRWRGFVLAVVALMTLPFAAVKSSEDFLTRLLPGDIAGRFWWLVIGAFLVERLRASTAKVAL